jgi:hypothetical protein
MQKRTETIWSSEKGLNAYFSLGHEVIGKAMGEQKKFKVTIEEEGLPTPKSNPQLSYVHGVIVPWIAEKLNEMKLKDEETGEPIVYDLETAKSFFKRVIGFVDKVKTSDGVIETEKSFKPLSQDEMGHLIEMFNLWCMDKFKVVPPPPREQ